MKSILQKMLTGLDDKPKHIGDAVVAIDPMFQDLGLRPFVEAAEAIIWMAPCRHFVGYCIVSVT